MSSNSNSINSKTLSTQTIEDVITISLLEIEGGASYVVRTVLVGWGVSHVVRECYTLVEAIAHYTQVCSSFNTLANKINDAIQEDMSSAYDMFVEQPPKQRRQGKASQPRRIGQERV